MVAVTKLGFLRIYYCFCCFISLSHYFQIPELNTISGSSDDKNSEKEQTGVNSNSIPRFSKSVSTTPPLLLHSVKVSLRSF
jgi:hypothetical protein